MVRHENIPALPVSDWSVMRIYPRFLCLIGHVQLDSAEVRADVALRCQTISELVEESVEIEDPLPQGHVWEGVLNLNALRRRCVVWSMRT